MPDDKKPPLKPTLPPVLEGKVGNAAYRDSLTEETLPTVLSLLQTVFDEHGRVTWEGASLTVRLRAGTCWLSLTCPTSETQTTMEIRSLATLLEEAEQLIRGNKCTWEPTYKKAKKMRSALADATKQK